MTDVDYSNKILNYHVASVTTDGSGQAAITLDFEPVSVNAIIPLATTALRRIEIVSLATKTLTINIRKTGTRFWNVGDVDADSLPLGVTVATSSPRTTSEVSASVSQIMTRASAGGGGSFAPASHTHTITKEFQHHHGLDTGTSVALGSNTADLLATTETVDVIIIYASNP